MAAGGISLDGTDHVGNVGLFVESGDDDEHVRAVNAGALASRAPIDDLHFEVVT